MKKFLKAVAIVLCIVIVIALGYVAYMFIDYSRIEDNVALEVESQRQDSEYFETDTVYKAATYNVGFGAYLPDYSFFMDGGKQSWGESKDTVSAAISGASELVAQEINADLALFQEVDVDGTRSYHINEYGMIIERFPGFWSVFAQNYDSSFIAYPFTQPHGANRSGLVTLSRYEISSSLRRSLPISTAFSKFFDLDRAYSVSRMPVSNGKELVVINIHMSAYSDDAAVRDGQLNMLREQMATEYAMGNYVICGGDYNHDLKLLEDDGTEKLSWAYPYLRSDIPENFSFGIDSLDVAVKDAMHNSCRNADIPYDPEVSFTITVDGFIISDNIQCVSYENMDLGYKYSDHDPVVMEFTLMP